MNAPVNTSWAPTMDFDADLGFFERREGSRHLSVFRVGRLCWVGEDELCIMRNVSSGGAMIEAVRCPDPFAAVTLELRTDQRIDSEVRWRRGDHAGLRFPVPIDVERLLRDERNPLLRTRPRAPRFDRLGAVRLTVRERRIPGTIVNISIAGLCIEVPGVVGNTDEPVIVHVEGLGAAHAVLRWRRRDLVGLRLARPFAYQPFRIWLNDAPRPVVLAAD